MRQGQPHGAELGDTGTMRVEEATGDVDVRLSIAVEQKGVVTPTPPDGYGRGDYGRCEYQQRFEVADGSAGWG